MSEIKYDRYRLERKLGSGGMGDVWLATDILLDRPVAIKYMLHVEDLTSKDQFLAEARLLASLNHINITTIYDVIVDEAKHEYLMVIEYVEGRSLSKLIKEGPLPLREVLRIGMAIVEALQYAHNQGVVHRDMKPANVLLSGDDVKITDFGLASLMEDISEDGGYIYGTITYVAPEHIDGLPVDHRADLYAVGIILFEMLTGGKYPYRAKSEEDLFWAHLTQKAESVRKLVPEVSFLMERTIRRLLAKDPFDRFQSAAALMSVLQTVSNREKFSRPRLNLLKMDAVPLLGRQKELAHLKLIWAELIDRAQAKLVVLRSEMGMGKSALVTAFLREFVVDRGMPAFMGQSSEVSRPYKPFSEILVSLFESGLVTLPESPGQIEALLRQVPQLVTLFQAEVVPTELDDKLEAEPGENDWDQLSLRIAGDTIGDPQLAQWQFFDMVLLLLSEINPVVLFLEDAAFLDEASAALVHYIIRNSRFPVLVIAACQEGVGSLDWLQRFRPEEVETVTLSPLSAQGTNAFLTRAMDGPVSKILVQVAQETSQGNLFYLQEITHHFLDQSYVFKDTAGVWQLRQGADTDSLPESLIHLLSGRMEGMTPAYREALTLAAVIGARFDFETWVQMLGGEEKVSLALDTLDEALRMRFIQRTAKNRYLFYPRGLASVIAGALSDPRREYLHQQIAAYMLVTDQHPARVAYHCLGAGLVDEAARHYEIAGTQAMTSNALSEAIAYFEQSGNLIPSKRVFQLLGNLYRQKGFSTESIQAFEKALVIAREEKDVRSEATILNGLSLVLWIYDQYKKAFKCAHTALHLEDAPLREKATAQSHLGMISWLVGRLDEAENWCRHSVNTLEAGEDRASLAGALSRLGLVCLSLGKLDEAEDYFNHSADLRSALGDYWGQGYSINGVGRVDIERGKFEEGLELFEEVLKLFVRIGSQDGQMVVYANHGKAYLRQGMPQAALPLLRRAHALALSINKRSAYGLGEIFLLMAQAYTDSEMWDKAQTAVHNALKIVEPAGNQEYVAIGEGIQAQLYDVRGEEMMARAMYESAINRLKEMGALPELLRTRLRYVRFLARQVGEDTSIMEKTIHRQAAKIGLYLQ